MLNSVPMLMERESDETLAHNEGNLSATMILTVKGKRVNIRKKALSHYRKPGQQIVCVFCGFGIEDVLEVAHLDTDRTNNDHTNWAFLCPTCHRMHDLGLIPTQTIRDMRDQPKTVNWKLLMKDAGAKAAVSRGKTLKKQKRQVAAKKAVATRGKNAANKTPAG